LPLKHASSALHDWPVATFATHMLVVEQYAVLTHVPLAQG
jgi:hypothetical protein